MGGFYWERHPDGPFATLIAVVATYCSPDAYDGAYDDLISRARAPDPGDEEIRIYWRAATSPRGSRPAAWR